MITERWHIQLLGGLRLQQRDTTITRFKTQKVAGLLAYLAYYLRQAHPREVLIDLFWPDSELEAGRGSLSVALSSLRNQLEPPGIAASTVLRADRFSISLNPRAVTIDVMEFEAAVRAAPRAGSGTERIQILEQAVGLYKGRLLPGLYEDWIVPEGERLAGLFFDAVASLLADLNQLGDYSTALRYARQAVGLDPLREEAQDSLIRLLVSSGQPIAAWTQYREFERLLDVETGEEPSASLRALARQIERDSGQMPPSLPAPILSPNRPAVSLAPPSGHPSTLTFLLTHVLGSVGQGDPNVEGRKADLAAHHDLLRQQVAAHGGQVIRETDEGFVIAFQSARQALACAVASHQALSRHAWPMEVGPPAVRMALHTGDVEHVDGDYRGPALDLAARLLTAGHAGQILLSQVTAELVSRDLPDDLRLVDLGAFRLRNVPRPERLHHIEYPGMTPERFPAPAAEFGLQARLPMQVTRFFGREQEIARIIEALTPADTRGDEEKDRGNRTPSRDTAPLLVTLTGSGGTGKSRLAIEAAERLVERFQGAVWFVGLADLSDAALIPDAILDVLHIPRTPQRESLELAVEALSRQPSLLVLDNFEHLIPGGTTFVQTLLHQARSLRLLITSRQRLGISGERELAVPPLSIPNGGEAPAQLSLFESVALFVDRAQAVLPYFQVTNSNAPAVAELCQRLEGIPLAIELAAARAHVLAPAQMLLQVSNRFEFLTSRKRGVQERHRTLRAAIDWSYRLLAPEVQRFFARLSVFRDGWSLEAAERVCEEPLALDYLAQLLDGSLLLSEESARGVRFRMLETLRDYGAERLEDQRETNSLRDRHLRFYAAHLEPEADDACGVELSNLRMALSWAIETDSELGLGLILRMGGFWHRRGPHREGREWFQRLLTTPATQGTTLERARALSAAAYLARFDGRTFEAKALYEECLKIYFTNEDTVESCEELGHSGYLAYEMGDYEAAARIAEEWAERATRIDRNISGPLLLKAVIAGAQGDFQNASHFCRQSRVEMRKDGYDALFVRQWQGLYDARCGDFDRGRALIEETLVLARSGHEIVNEIRGLTFLSIVALMQNDIERACGSVREALVLLRDIGNPFSRHLTLHQAGNTAAAIGRKERAVTIFSAHCALSMAAGEAIHPSEHKDDEALLTELRSSLADRFEDAWEAGRKMTWEQAVAYALEEGQT